MKWKTKDGQIMKLRDMTTDHINNCINLLENKIDNLEPFIYLGDDDSDMMLGISLASGHQLEIARHEMNRMIKSFQRELKRRNL